MWAAGEAWATAENCQSLPVHVAELPAGIVAPASVPGRHDATFKHQPQTEVDLKIHWAAVF
jgi:hypothetical protein